MTDRRKRPVLAAAVTGAAALSVVLIGYALTRSPTALPAVAGSAALMLAVLAGCAAFPWFGPLSTRHSGQHVVHVGAAVGLVLGGALVAVDLTTPAMAIPVEFVTLGTMALAYAVAGAIAGIRAALWTALVGYLVWYPTIWLYYFVGYGSATYDRALRAEGEYDDFHRSGLTDFTTFLLRDFLGAGFFHLLLGVLLALGAGAGAAGIVVLTRRVLHTGPARPSRRRMLTVALAGTVALAATVAGSVPAIAAPAHHPR